MSLELLNTLATFGTFVVIAATAVTALFQLRHARSANLIQSLSQVTETFNQREMQQAQSFVITEFAKKWQDPSFRYQTLHRDARTAENQSFISQMMLVGNAYEQLGLLVKRGLVDRIMALELFGGNAITAWGRLATATAALRRVYGNATYENFEYLVAIARQWDAAHPNGTFPAGVPREPLPDELRDADAAYMNTLALTSETTH